jgi:hypothetical protein
MRQVREIIRLKVSARVPTREIARLCCLDRARDVETFRKRRPTLAFADILQNHYRIFELSRHSQDGVRLVRKPPSRLSWTRSPRGRSWVSSFAIGVGRRIPIT